MTNYIGRYIYFIRPEGMQGPIKIGCSNKPARRLIALSVWSPYPLEIIAVAPGDLTLEKRVHEYFAAERWHHEWFLASPRLLTACELLKRNVPLFEAIPLDGRMADAA